MLLFSFLNPAHELRVGALLAEELPGVPVVALVPRGAGVPRVRARLHHRPQRGAAAADRLVSAALRSEVASAGVGVPLHLMQTNGGVAPAGAPAGCRSRWRPPAPRPV